MHSIWFVPKLTNWYSPMPTHSGETGDAGLMLFTMIPTVRSEDSFEVHRWTKSAVCNRHLTVDGLIKRPREKNRPVGLNRIIAKMCRYVVVKNWQIPVRSNCNISICVAVDLQCNKKWNNKKTAALCCAIFNQNARNFDRNFGGSSWYIRQISKPSVNGKIQSAYQVL